LRPVERPPDIAMAMEGGEELISDQEKVTFLPAGARGSGDGPGRAIGVGHRTDGPVEPNGRCRWLRRLVQCAFVCVCGGAGEKKPEKRNCRRNPCACARFRAL